MNAFKRIFRWQLVTFFLLGLLTFHAVWGDDASWVAEIVSKSDVPVVIGAIGVAMAVQFLGNIWHELSEINDQLAGRSPEFYEFLRSQPERGKL